MAKPDEFSAIGRDQLRGFPPNHPALEESPLTLFQQFAYPVLLWFFDSHRNRATGRSYLMAKVIVELAKRGEPQDVVDYTQMGHRKQHNSYFVDMVMRIARQDPRDLFDYNHSQNRLTYAGRRP